MHCLGSYGGVASMDMIASSRGERHPTSWAALKGKRWVIASETEKNRGWDESKIKVATGGDPITARFMRADEFTYQPQFKFHIIGNHEPKLRDVEEAMRRRFVLLPFRFKPSVVDRDLEEKLKAEGPAILGWMIEGCFTWQRHGLAVPRSIMAATSSFFERQDVLGQWIEECCRVGPDLQATVGELFCSWSEYLKAQGEPAPTSRAFAQDMRRKGFQPAKSGAQRRYRGLALLSVDNERHDYDPFDPAMLDG
jgi:putative DNA primase/helicase